MPPGQVRDLSDYGRAAPNVSRTQYALQDPSLSAADRDVLTKQLAALTGPAIPVPGDPRYVGGGPSQDTQDTIRRAVARGAASSRIPPGLAPHVAAEKAGFDKVNIDGETFLRPAALAMRRHVGPGATAGGEPGLSPAARRARELVMAQQAGGGNQRPFSESVTPVVGDQRGGVLPAYEAFAAAAKTRDRLQIKPNSMTLEGQDAPGDQARVVVDYSSPGSTTRFASTGTSGQSPERQKAFDDHMKRVEAIRSRNRGGWGWEGENSQQVRAARPSAPAQFTPQMLAGMTPFGWQTGENEWFNQYLENAYQQARMNVFGQPAQPAAQAPAVQLPAAVPGLTPANAIGPVRRPTTRVRNATPSYMQIPSARS